MATIFNDFAKATIGSPVYSHERWAERLGTFDSLGIAVVVDHPDAVGGTINVYLEHSADGRVWHDKVATTPCASGTVVAGQTYLAGADPSPGPSLAFVRFRIYFDPPTRAGRVRLQVSARDRGP